MEGLPICFFPTEVVFVDDSEIYLQTLSLVLESQKTLRFKTFSTPELALRYIQSKQAIPKLYSTWEDTFSPNCYALKLDVFSLHKLIYNRQRYEQVSVVIADHDLRSQSMNGVEFCQKIQDTDIQKILFTGRNDQDFVIQAFNHGQIQQYVPKKDIKNIQDMLEVISQAQRRYFLNYNSILKAVIRRTPDFPLAIDSDKFKAYFNHFIQTNDIVEFYILDVVGSYLMINSKHRAQILMVQNEDQCLANELEYYEEVDSELCQQLQARQVICYNPKFWDPDQQQGTPQFLSAHCLEDPAMKAKFYCACIPDPQWISLDQVEWE